MWAFANSDQVRAAIHGRSIREIGRFDECSDRINYTSDRGATMLPVHADNIARGALHSTVDIYTCPPLPGQFSIPTVRDQRTVSPDWAEEALRTQTLMHRFDLAASSSQH